MKYTIVLLLVAYLGFTAGDADINYYWRNYFGKIPDDAVAAGGNSYVAQVWASRQPYFGAIPTSIYEGNTSVRIPLGGNTEVSSPIQILCSPNPEAFAWLPTTTDTFDQDTSETNVVFGGWQTNSYLQDPYPADVFIGRHDGYVGKLVDIFADGFLHFYYANDITVKESASFEVLTYNLLK